MFMEAKWGGVRTRELRPTDADALNEVFDAMSPDSRYLRFHGATSRLTDRAQRALLDVDGVRHHALLAEVREERRWRPIGIARYTRSSEVDDEAEAAVEVADDWQGRGIGLLLLRELLADAHCAGVRSMVGNVLTDNRRVVNMIRKHFVQLGVTLRDGTLHIAVSTGDPCPC